jgi:hypothetical protein
MYDDTIISDEENGKDYLTAPVDQENQNLPTIGVIKTNANLAYLPLCSLSWKNLKDFELDLPFVVKRDNKRLEVYWGVSSNQKFGYPSPFAEKVRLAIEHLAMQQDVPIPEYLEFSTCEIEQILDLKHGGSAHRNIKRALQSLSAAKIETRGSFCYLENGQRRWVEDLFNLYDRVVWVGQTLPDGTIAEKNRVSFSEWYHKSLNSLYVKPLDFAYWKEIVAEAGIIAGRLYNYLGYMMFATKGKKYSIYYHKLCRFLPLDTKPYLSQAERQLARPHKTLVKTGFLKGEPKWGEPRWIKLEGKKVKSWLLTYNFGIRSQQELARGFRDALPSATIDIDIVEDEVKTSDHPEGQRRNQHQARMVETQPKDYIEAIDDLQPEYSEIIAKLCERGIAKTVAVDFAQHFPEDYLWEKISMHDVAKAGGGVKGNAAGWLRRAIEQDYQWSEEQLKKHQAMKERLKQEKSKREFDEQALAVQEERLQAKLLYFPSLDDWVEEQVNKRVCVRELIVSSNNIGEPYTETEIDNMRRQLIAEYPVEEDERRVWLRSEDEDCRLDIIKGELERDHDDTDKLN